jgi:RNA polymerase primary sigma factor
MPIRSLSSVPSSETPSQRDERLYEEWNDAPMGWSKDQAFDRLVKSLEPAIQAAANTYRAAPVPTQTMDLEAKRLGGLAIKDWDPKAGMSLASYVGTMVRQRLYRWVTQNQNVARLPEAQVGQIGHFQLAINDLTSRFGREPTTDELADHMGISPNHVGRLRRSLRSDLIASNLMDADGDEGAPGDTIEDIPHDPDYERAMLGYYGLTAQEKSVFDYSLGAHGLPKIKPGEIAQKLSLSPARISAIKESIGEKIRPYLRAG